MRALNPIRLLVAGVFLAGVSALAQAYRAEDILKKHRKALGGDAVIAGLVSIVYEADVQAGQIKGTITKWMLPPNRTRAETSLATIEEKAVFDGKTLWTVNASGNLSLGDEPAQKSALSEALLDCYGYAFPDSSLKLRFLTREGELGRSFVVIEATPLAGVPFKLWIDEETWLCAKSEMADDGFKVVSEYDDYRSVQGLMFPYRIYRRIPQLGQEFEITVKEVRLNEPVDERLFLRYKPPAEEYRMPDRKTSTFLPFEFKSGRIWLTGKIQGEGPFDFILDSRAEVSMLDAALAAKLGFSTAGEFKLVDIEGYLEMPLVEVDSFELGGLRLYGQVIATAEPSKMVRLYPGRAAAMVLGYDFLSRFATEIRFSSDTIVIYELKGFAAPSGYGFIACSYDARVPVIQASLEGLWGRFILDCASASSVDLAAPFVKRNNLKKDRLLFASELYEARDGKVLLGRMKYMTIGPYVIENPVVGFAEGDKPGLLASSTYDGIIGNEIVRRFDVIFDYQGERLALRPNDALNEPFRTAKSGLLLESGTEGSIQVVGTIPSSPADKAQIEPGSELLEVNGQNARKIGIEGIKELFTGAEGTQIELRTEKNGQLRISKLTLETYY